MKLATLVFSALVVVAVTATDSSAAVIFGAAQNGDFGGDSAGDLLPTPDDSHNAPTTNAGTRRATTGGSYFYENIAISANAFGGIDQVNGNGNPGLLANDGTTTTAEFFVGSGSVAGAFGPSGDFLQSFSPGNRLDVTFDVLTNAGGNPGDSSYDISIIFDGGTPVSLASGFIPDAAAGTTAISESFFVTSAASSFRVLATIANPSTGNDQIGLDNLEINFSVPEPCGVSITLLGLAAAAVRRRRS